MIYHNPVRDSRKVSDFEVQSWRPGLRELYERVMVADALAETILAFHGGGGAWREALTLAGTVLDSLNDADEAACSRLGVHFLWQWAGIMGLRLSQQPDNPPLEQARTLSKGLLAGALGRKLHSWDGI
jgi:DNA repair protein RecO (recombination protein O)